MPHRPDLRDAALESPTLKELRRFTRVRQALWRPDWPLNRHAVLVAGLGMLTLQRPELGLRTQPLAVIEAGLADLELPDRFLKTCMERFDQWRRGPRVSVFGADLAPPGIVGARFAKLVAPTATWTLLTTCNRRTPWNVHDWSLTHYVPVEYMGDAADRFSRSLAASIVDASEHVVVFERRRDKRFDHVLQRAKLAKRKLFLELYDPADNAGEQFALVAPT